MENIDTSNKNGENNEQDTAPQQQQVQPIVEAESSVQSDKKKENDNLNSRNHVQQDPKSTPFYIYHE